MLETGRFRGPTRLTRQSTPAVVVPGVWQDHVLGWTRATKDPGCRSIQNINYSCLQRNLHVWIYDCNALWNSRPSTLSGFCHSVKDSNKHSHQHHPALHRISNCESVSVVQSPEDHRNMATTSSSSSRQPVPTAERPSRDTRAGKEAQRSGKRRQQQQQEQRQPQRHHQRRLSRDDPLEEETDLEEGNDGLSRDEAALIDARFHRAVDIIQSLPKSGPITTTYEEKLMLYSLYKQGRVERDFSSKESFTC